MLGAGYLQFVINGKDEKVDFSIARGKVLLTGHGFENYAVEGEFSQANDFVLVRADIQQYFCYLEIHGVFLCAVFYGWRFEVEVRQSCEHLRLSHRVNSDHTVVTTFILSIHSRHVNLICINEFLINRV